MKELNNLYCSCFCKVFVIIAISLQQNCKHLSMIIHLYFATLLSFCEMLTIEALYDKLGFWQIEISSTEHMEHDIIDYCTYACIKFTQWTSYNLVIGRMVKDGTDGISCFHTLLGFHKAGWSSDIGQIIWLVGWALSTHVILMT